MVGFWSLFFYFALVATNKPAQIGCVYEPCKKAFHRLLSRNENQLSRQLLQQNGLHPTFSHFCATHMISESYKYENTNRISNVQFLSLVFSKSFTSNIKQPQMYNTLDLNLTLRPKNFFTDDLHRGMRGGKGEKIITEIMWWWCSCGLLAGGVLHVCRHMWRTASPNSCAASYHDQLNSMTWTFSHFYQNLYV